LRHLATVGGALLAQDGPPEVLLALLALAASVVVHGQGGKTREQSLVDFVAAREQSLARDELVVEVRFAHPGQSSGALERVARTPRDEAIVAVAAILAVEEGVCRQARLALAGATSRPQRLWAVEQFLEGRPLTSDEMLLAVEMAMAEAVNPPADYRGSADYRRAMAGVLTRRALTSAWQRATTSNQESLST
jgi:carbon-monoxide dehydrogenase medium subunit